MKIYLKNVSPLPVLFLPPFDVKRAEKIRVNKILLLEKMSLQSCEIDLRNLLFVSLCLNLDQDLLFLARSKNLHIILSICKSHMAYILWHSREIGNFQDRQFSENAYFPRIGKFFQCTNFG